MTWESLYKKKWWHATLEIRKRDTSLALLSRLSSYTRTTIATNNMPNNIFAYYLLDDTQLTIEQVEVPVPAFDVLKAPGIFVYKPNVAQLNDSFFVAYNLNDVNNTANRRLINHFVNAAYDANDVACLATTPNTLDPGIYFSETEQDSSIFCLFPNLPTFITTNCCTPLFASTRVVRPVFYEQTIMFVLTSEIADSPPQDSNNIYYKYRIYEYDYALSGSPDAFILRGEYQESATTRTSSATKLLIYDIAFLPSQNTSGTIVTKLYAITDEGFKEIIFTFDIAASGAEVKLFRLMSVESDWQNPNFTEDRLWYQLNRRNFYSNKACSIEYSTNNRRFYINASPTINDGIRVDPNRTPQSFPATSVVVPNIYECELSASTSTNGDVYKMKIANNRIQREIPQPFAITRITRNNLNEDLYYGVYDRNLVSFTFDGPINYINRNNLFANLNNLAFVKNPDEILQDNVFLGTNRLGQIFKINLQDAAVQTLPDMAPYEIEGVASLLGISNYQFRPKVLPFDIGTSSSASAQNHWMFVIDLNQAGAVQSGAVRNTLINFISNFLRYDDKITFIFYNENITNRETFVVRTSLDIDAIITFVNDNYQTQSPTSFIYNVTSTIATEYRDVDEIIFIGPGSGTYADVVYSPDGFPDFTLFKRNLTTINSRNNNTIIFRFIVINDAGQDNGTNNGIRGAYTASTQTSSIDIGRKVYFNWVI